MKKKMSSKKGFTLIEILVVIGIIAILAAIVIIAINPARQFAQSRNTQRVSNLNTILNGIGQAMADNKGVFDASTGSCSGVALASATASTTIYSDASAYTAGTPGHIGLGCLSPTYIPAGIPQDPSLSTGVDTGYQVSVDASQRVTICAPKSKDETAISTNPPLLCVTR